MTLVERPGENRDANCSLEVPKRKRRGGDAGLEIENVPIAQKNSRLRKRLNCFITDRKQQTLNWDHSFSLSYRSSPLSPGAPTRFEADAPYVPEFSLLLTSKTRGSKG
jgi:hypothetical protein